MSDQADHFEAINRVGKRLEDEAAKLGLKLEHFGVATMSTPRLTWPSD